MFGVYYNWREDNVKKSEAILTKFSLLNSHETTVRVDKFLKKIKFRSKVVGEDQNSCTLIIRDSNYFSHSLEDRFFIMRQKKKCQNFNLLLIRINVLFIMRF